MSLSVFTKKVIRAGLANRVAANELIAAVDTLANLASMDQGAAVAAIGALATVHAALGAPAVVGTGAVDVACALAADVDARLTDIHTAFDDQITAIDARVTTLQATIDALTASLRTVNLIAT